MKPLHLEGLSKPFACTYKRMLGYWSSGSSSNHCNPECFSQERDSESWLEDSGPEFDLGIWSRNQFFRLIAFGIVFKDWGYWSWLLFYPAKWMCLSWWLLEAHYCSFWESLEIQIIACWLVAPEKCHSLTFWTVKIATHWNCTTDWSNGCSYWSEHHPHSSGSRCCTGDRIDTQLLLVESPHSFVWRIGEIKGTRSKGMSSPSASHCERSLCRRCLRLTAGAWNQTKSGLPTAPPLG